MKTFRRALAAHADASASDASGRDWLFVPYDQLTDAVGPLARRKPRELGIIVVECPGKAARRPYHQQKLALVLTNLRHFALEQAARGVAVRHVVADSYAEALSRQLAPDPARGKPAVARISMMKPAERELRAELAPLVESGRLTVLEHEGWLTTTEDFRAATEGRAWRMDAFYRQVRRRLDLLMVKGKPLGGRMSFDGENRRPWNGEPPAPSLPTFVVDDITAEVCDLVRTELAHHPGRLQPEALPATQADAERSWEWAKRECLPMFGPFEDAMSTRSRTLFHTRISALLNLQRLPARRVLDDVIALDIPLASKEGFVRQLVGWREYLRHAHEATDGFRVLHGAAQACATAPGDGGHARWANRQWHVARGDGAKGDGGSLASALGAQAGVPPAYWGARSGLQCLDAVVGAVWEDGYSHHITRLMVLSNIAMLLDVSPRELTDWFWAAYIDAYDWVVEPNVHAMGTFGVGDLLTTKPYIAGAGYIDRMSDHCGTCQFDPKTTCPLTPMYWAFLGRHRERLAAVDRMKLPILAESRRSAQQRSADAAVFERVSAVLQRGEALTTEQRSLFDATKPRKK